MSEKDKKEPPKDTAKSQEAKEPPKFLLQVKKVFEIASKISKAVVSSPIIQEPRKRIKEFGLFGWLKVFACITVALLTYGVFKTAPQWKKLWKLPYLSSFEGIADHKYNYASDTKVIRYDNDLLMPQFVVMVNKIVVNIRPGKLSTANPMIAFDLYVKTDSDATSVEIKQREKQIQDHLQRFCEGLNYDQIQTEEGKLTWKNRMKRELNLILNSGRVKDVFFKTLIVKP